MRSVALVVLVVLGACSRSPIDGQPDASVPTVPGAPEAPSAIEGDSQVSVHWLPPRDTGSGPLSSYVVQWEGGSQTVGADQTTLVITGLINGTGYSFVVSAVNEVGTGPASSPSPMVFPGGPPAPPSQVVAVGGPGKAVVTWREPDGRGRPITEYTVTSFSGESVTTNSTTATLTGLRPGRYTFAVAAKNALGTGAPASSNETVVTVPLPGIPREVTAELTATGALVRWAPPANGGVPTGYVVASLPAGLSATTTATEAAISGLQPGLNYKFWVSATNESGAGERSNPSAPIMLKQGPACSSTTPFFGGPPDPVQVFRPLALSSADLDRDGKLDLAVIDATTLYVARGRGNGTFEREVPYAVGANASSLSVGELSGDSLSDVVVSNGDAGVSVFLSDGVGGLLNPDVYSSGGEATFVALTRVDSNASLDLAILNHTQGTLTVMLNDGAGHFVARAPFFVGREPWELAASDFNRDGVTDLAITSGITDVHVLVGNGDGTFQPTPPLLSLTSGATRSLVSGDFDHDGHADLIVPSVVQYGGVIFLGNGDATFAGASFALGAGRFITQGDLDGDGEQDLVLLQPERDRLSVLRGSSNGSFQLVSTQAGGTELVWATLGDFNNDGRGDIVVADQGNPYSSIPSGSVTILLGTSTGFYAPNRTTLGNLVMTAFLADDFDVDGHQDVVVGQQEGPGSWGVKMLLGDGDGGFLPAFTVGQVGTAAEMRSGDFNRDGLPDLAVTDTGPWGPNLAIFMGIGGGSFDRSVRYEGNGAGPFSLTLDDFNADGFSDLAVATHSYMGVDVYLGSATGTFGAAQRFVVGGGPRSIVSADFNRDRMVDLATANESSSTVSVLFGQGEGLFFPRRDFGVGARPLALAVADLNEDLFPDLVTANEDARSLTVLFGGASGFAPAVTIVLPTTPRDVMLVDVTLDGKFDVLVALLNGRVLLLKGNGDGTFASPVFFSAANSSGQLAVGQFDGDGRLDIAVLGGGVSVLENVCAP